jgi:hypothetical protein
MVIKCTKMYVLKLTALSLSCYPDKQTDDAMSCPVFDGRVKSISYNQFPDIQRGVCAI